MDRPATNRNKSYLRADQFEHLRDALLAELDPLRAIGFALWFSIVTPLTEIGLLPIGSRPAKRGLDAKALDDLHHPVDLLLGTGAHQSGRMVRPGHRMRTVR